MIGPFLFLDFDGVLNHHVQHENKYCGTCPSCVVECNRIIKETGAKIVVASAWRYFVHRGEMTIAGLSGLMCTHGLAWGSIVDVLAPETDVIAPDRGQLVIDWFKKRFGSIFSSRHLVIDDLDLGYTSAGLQFIQPESDGGLCGMPSKKIDNAISILGRIK